MGRLLSTSGGGGEASRTTSLGWIKRRVGMRPRNSPRRNAVMRGRVRKIEASGRKIEYSRKFCSFLLRAISFSVYKVKAAGF